MSKKSLLIEFARSTGGMQFRTVEELERGFSNWLQSSGRRLVTFGRDYFDNEFEGSVDYTIDLFEKDPGLMDYFGFDYSDLEDTKYRTGYYERKHSRSSGSRSTGNQRNSYGYSEDDYYNQRGSTGNRRSGTGGRSGSGSQRGGSTGRKKSSSSYDGYSLSGQFKSYLDGIKDAGRGRGGSFSLSQFFKSPVGIVIIAIVALVLIYKILGPAVYSFITSGAIFRVICFVLGGLATFGIVKSKNMGWPIYIKAIVIFVIWLVLLKYDF